MIERAVKFDIIKDLAVVPKVVLAHSAFRIEMALPSGIAPARTTDIQLQLGTYPRTSS